MFNPVNEPPFRLDVAGLSDAFEVLAFTGREAISEPFLFDVDLLIEDPTLDLASLLYRFASLHFGPSGNVVHGQLQQLVQRNPGGSDRRCRVQLRPKLACLAQRFSQRIFSALTVPQILDQLLLEHGIVDSARRFQLTGEYLPRNFCTQYRESDLQFLQRLCAQERLHYYFEHQAHRHCVVFGESAERLRTLEPAVFQATGKSPAVRQIGYRHRPHHTHNVEGRSDLPMLRSGHLMPLTGHPVPEWNDLWLLTHIEHHGCQQSANPYRNQLRAIHGCEPFLPSQPATKPLMHSPQRAWVVDVDEPHPDPARRVAVQFDWLYQGEGATPSHCWLALDESLACAGSEPLTAGTEVVVKFIGGDLDQPLITGFLHVATRVEKPQKVRPQIAHPLTVDLQELLRSGEPLMLMCLLPGGGSFSHCARSFCACRLVTRHDPSGTA